MSETRQEVPDLSAAVRAVFTSFNELESMAVKVMEETVKSAQEDVDDALRTLRAINATKAALRAQQARVRRDVAANAHRSFDDSDLSYPSGGMGGREGYVRAKVAVLDVADRSGFRLVTTNLAGPATLSRADLEATLDQFKSDLDSLSEMGEMMSLRLQMAMDRMSKLMSTLSNLLKKISDTAQSITQNMK